MYLWINKLQTSNVKLQYLVQQLSERYVQLTEEWWTQRCLKRGGWGRVVKSKSCSGTAAVLKIHQEIQNLSSYYRELFEWEMHIASRCHHPIVSHNSLNSLEQQTMNYQVPFWLQSSVKESSSQKLPELWSLPTAEVAVGCSWSIKFLAPKQTALRYSQRY